MKEFVSIERCLFRVCLVPAGNLSNRVCRTAFTQLPQHTHTHTRTHTHTHTHRHSGMALAAHTPATPYPPPPHQTAGQPTALRLPAAGQWAGRGRCRRWAGPREPPGQSIAPPMPGGGCGGWGGVGKGGSPGPLGIPKIITHAQCVPCQLGQRGVA